MKENCRLNNGKPGMASVLLKTLKCCWIFLLFAVSSCHSQSNNIKARSAVQQTDRKVMLTGADQPDVYLPQMKGKRIGIVANPTSVINATHLVDTLVALKVKVACVFAPEHGFRGEAEAGEDVSGGTDRKTGVKVISLYGDHKKPTKEDLNGIDLVLFDIQDVGVRFYTYISTLQYVMESCAENHLPLMVLDRPNPHAHYVDGPVLKKEYVSFVGMQPVPVVYGMTMGEYAEMLNGEGWLKDGVRCDLTVVPLKFWKHSDDYVLPVAPSPNLPNQAAIRLYPSLCFFEGTDVSLGRGTDYPFQCYGFPDNENGTFEFTPVSIPGKAKTPPQMGKKCKGELLHSYAMQHRPDKLQLEWLLKAYAAYPDTSKFFIPFFDKLSGNAVLQQQIRQGLSESEIRASWKADLDLFRKIRSKYLHYP